MCPTGGAAVLEDAEGYPALYYGEREGGVLRDKGDKDTRTLIYP